MTVVVVFADVITLGPGAMTFGRIFRGGMRTVRGRLGIIIVLSGHLIARGNWSAYRHGRQQP